ncbi:GyrI-like domain-containing protein [Natronorubrum halophilum]|uniref:GyrI-like domain-containing protein n=1 Tax=Natronorubrum halophilum TaxID=1702106 RepID=UPI0010C169D7|nr:GyrI-like domain-containing protein [Natronorubrum halophilum]
MENIDFKRELSEIYQQTDDEVSLVDVLELNYLMIDGHGDPNTSSEYEAAIETLYPLSYAIRAIIKEEEEFKYVVMPLEGLWWTDDMESFDVENKSEWQWTLMIMQPDFVTETIVERARDNVRDDKDLPSLSEMRFESLDEGTSAQTLHVGPFSDEGSTVKRIHEFIETRGFSLRGRHHEIYLSDMRRTEPERLKTIIRQPVET